MLLMICFLKVVGSKVCGGGLKGFSVEGSGFALEGFG